MTERGDRSAAIGMGLLAAAFVALAFAGKGGTDLTRLAEVETWIVVGGAGVLVAAVLAGRGTPGAGVWPVVAFVALAVLTALSISWSLAPDASWLEANRTLAYLFAFAAAVAAGTCAPGSLRALLGALTLAATALVAYGLATRVWPGALAELEFYARLGTPFGYWNAVGVTAAMGLVGVVWFGSRRELSARAGALAAPAATLLLVALLLTYSRSGLLAATVAIALWLVFVPLRLRSIAVLAAAVVGSAPAIAWALSQAAFTEDGVELARREDAGTTLGLLLLLSTAVAYAVCFAAFRWRARHDLPPAARLRAGRAALVAGACVVVLGLGAVATTDRGLGGTLSDRLEELTDDSAQAGAGPARLGTTASARGRYWRRAGRVFEDHPVAGAGAGAFAVAALRYREDDYVSRQAHGYLVQTMADLGLVGLALTLLLAAAWLSASLRAVGALPRGAGRAWSNERVAVTALFLLAIAYGLQSALDWTWFVPGPTVMALAAAGFVAARPAPGLPARRAGGSRAAGPWRVALAGLVVAIALAAVSSAWQPRRALDHTEAALALAAAGDSDAALREAAAARDVNPLAPQAVWAQSAALVASGHSDEAHRVLEEAVLEHPNLADAWLRLADFRLDRLSRPEQALEAIEVALYLDPQSLAVQQGFIDIRDRFRAAGLLPAETAPPPQDP